jgi:hypothetical protein
MGELAAEGWPTRRGDEGSKVEWADICELEDMG